MAAAPVEQTVQGLDADDDGNVTNSNDGKPEIVNPNLQSPKTFWEKKPACVTKNTNTFWKELYTSRNDMKMECKEKFTNFFFPYGDNRHTPERRSSSSIGSSEENLCYDACDSTQYQRWVRRS